jgi:hypothetical protein
MGSILALILAQGDPKPEPVRTLYIDHLPRSEFQFLARIVTRDPSFRAHVFLSTADEEWTQPASEGLQPLTRRDAAAVLSDERRLQEYRLVVWGNLRPAQAGVKATRLKSFVESGGVLLFIAGVSYLRDGNPGPDLWELCPARLDVWNPPKKDPEIEALVRKLGSDEFAEREAATAKLRDLGPKAAPHLREGSRADDPEIQSRSEYLLKEIDSNSGASDPIRLRPTAAGRDLLKIEAGVWDRAPKIWWKLDGVTLRDGAATLIETEAGDPILVVRKFGKGLTALMATDDTWRWRHREGDYESVWRAILRALARPD